MGAAAMRLGSTVDPSADQAPELLAKYAIQSHILQMWIPRSVEARLLRSARTRPVVVLTGARQTGKTSTLFGSSPTISLSHWTSPAKPSRRKRKTPSFGEIRTAIFEQYRRPNWPSPSPVLK
jgi:hypothetical protein